MPVQYAMDSDTTGTEGEQPSAGGSIAADSSTATGTVSARGSGPDADASAAESVIAPETVFEVLSNERRRYVLHHLKATRERVSVRELSEQVAAWENGIEVAAVTPKERKRVYTALHQTHLPKMAEVGVIDYDRDRGTLELTAAIEAFDIYLEIVPERELSWSELSLALSSFSAALVAAVALGVYPFTLLPDIAYAAVIAAGWFVVGVAHTYVQRSERLGGGDPTDLSETLRPLD
ncbi:DUF7344 domain-containing protein [Haloglomus halophilum]|uniref:DUF7344 domain-containing protein n=1 Tax=Haloglomus halophilum TaxID=2962672 RepID=UPI0020C9BD47|nr:hypothetical protein [Haloglomus halophilum]